MVVTHELDSAFAIADKMILLKRSEKEDGDDWRGTIVYEEGTPYELRNSIKPYTVKFLGDFSYHGFCYNCSSVQKKNFIKCSNCDTERVKNDA